jgi:anti-sigma factor RsiW
MTCDRARTSLPEYIDGGLTPAARFAVEAHLSGCELCRAECEAQRRLARLLASMPRRQLGAEFDAALSARIRELKAAPERAGTKLWTRLRLPMLPAWQALAVPVAVAALCLTLWRPWAQPGQTPRPSDHQAYTGRIMAAYDTGSVTDLAESEAVDEALRASSVERLIE